MKVKAIITGASGMVGEGVLHECLQHNDVEEVNLIQIITFLLHLQFAYFHIFK